MTFIDHLRDKGSEEWTYTTYVGFDPDLHCCGLARVTVGESSFSRRRIQNVVMRDIIIPKRFRGLTAANQMIEELYCHEDLFVGHIGVVEGQQIYPPKGEGRDAVAKLVGQGMDLMNLAHVSGAALLIMLRHKINASIVLPAQWKAQAKKEAMHASAMKLIEGITAQGPEGGASIHAMDGLCMALKKAGFKV